jgi:hypothetical protein
LIRAIIALTQFVRAVILAICRDANETPIRLSLPVFQIPSELCLGVLGLAPKVALQLEDGIAEKAYSPASGDRIIVRPGGLAAPGLAFTGTTGISLSPRRVSTRLRASIRRS